MKCVCGYRGGEEWDTTLSRMVYHGRPFIKLQVLVEPEHPLMYGLHARTTVFMLAPSAAR